MGTSIFPGYIETVRDLLKRRKFCTDSTKSKLRICQLENDEKGVIQVREWPYDRKTQSWDPNLSRYLYGMSRNICIWIELWMNNLERSNTDQTKLLSGQCQYGDFKNLIKQGEGKEKCQIDQDRSRWVTFLKSDELNMSQTNQKDLQMCMEIVRILMQASGISRDGSGVRLNLGNQGSLCQRFYDELKAWGGQDVALNIMRHWFTVHNWPMGMQPEFLLTGRDLYEIITEEVLGTDAGIKDLVCKYESEKRERAEHPEEKFSDGQSIDTVIQESVGEGKQLDELENRMKSAVADLLSRIRDSSPSKGDSPPSKGDSVSVPLGGEGGGGSERNLLGMIGGVIFALSMGAVAVYGVSRVLLNRRRKPSGRKALRSRARNLSYRILSEEG
ncbi:hypothetical protein C922_03298 [Plasmodium inui San Antonio 1]|uniref:Uncharacterized protein n=1 Tax=Plasmodium inui San Antonio 1 TaxID=1237626 RepID=W6ZZM7_9APIC|nr:hypothetical protein C922_03298 [Plasmodium inui San Antonio 1]EUD66382.1 hypothetical protein C922_03298 [Plasmodium inui San Antonio 1]